GGARGALPPPAAPGGKSPRRPPRTAAVSGGRGGALVMVKPPPATAHPVARALDEAELASVVGTIAGDDTVFVATPSDGAARALARRLGLALDRRAGGREA